jgi:2,3-bisphosphoglycerate-dependent phosphoglycerate mutase
VTQLFLIRHGEAVTNVEPIIGGPIGDVGLTALGISQAQRLRERLAHSREIHADVVIASDLPRARQTAEIIAPAFGLPILFDPEVQEMRPGIADGMRLDEMERQFGVPNFRTDPLRPISPGGDNWPGFVLRVSSALERITREHAGKTIVVVCHGGVIDASFIYFFDMSSLRVPPAGWHTHNTSITHWELYGPPNGRPPRWRLVTYNDATHLRDLRSGEQILWEDMPQPEVGADEPSVPLPTEEEKD